MKNIIASKFIRIALWALLFHLSTTQRLAAQNIQFVINNFEKEGTVKPKYENLKEMIPENLKIIFSRSKYHRVPAILEKDLVYVLKSEFRREKNKKIVSVTCELINLMTPDTSSIYSETIQVFSDKKLLDSTNTIANTFSLGISDTIKKLLLKGSAKIFIGISEFEVKGDTSDQLKWLASLTLELLKEELLSSERFSISDKSMLSVYLIRGKFWQKDEFVWAGCDVIDAQTGSSKFDIKKRYLPADPEEVADNLAVLLFDDIIFHLSKGIRIAIADFSILGYDSTYISLEQAIPRMLESNLKGFAQLTFVELDETVALREILKTLGLKGRIDPRTELKIGKIMRPNYLILGGFCELSGKLRIDVRCLSIETGETIVSKGINVQYPDLDTIEARLTKLSSDIRASIAKDILEKSAENTVAVVGLPPLPNNEDNRKRIKHIIRAISKKLKTIDSKRIKVKEDRNKVESFIDKSSNIWKIAADLDVNRLFVIQYENYGEGDVTVSADIFSYENLSIPIFSCMKYGEAGQIRTLVNSVVLKSLDSLGVEKHIQYNPKRIKKMKDISVRRIAKSRSIGFSYGRVITDANKPLEYGENSSFVIYGSFPTPFRSESWYTYVRIMPMLTWDWGNNTLENLFQGTSTTSVHLISGFLMLVRKFWPERSVESYIGLGVGFLWLRRIYGEEYNFLHAPGEVHPGFAATLGGEFKMGQKYRFIIPLKFYHSAFWSFKAEDINGRHFNEGTLWGINFGIGLARYF